MAYNPTFMRNTEIVSGALGCNEFHYDTTDAFATVGAAGYINNARDLGMQVGDLVWVRTWPRMPNRNLGVNPVNVKSGDVLKGDLVIGAAADMVAKAFTATGAVAFASGVPTLVMARVISVDDEVGSPTYNQADLSPGTVVA
jgi:hypothetical protein